MTPARAKRNSKAPNRFSSDNSRIETSNANGETIIDYNDNSTTTTHSLAPIDRTIKLKPAMREPLKVKLPKLKRPHLQSTKDIKVKSHPTEIKILHKIKLPSLSSKKSKKTDNKSDSGSKINSLSDDSKNIRISESNINDSLSSTAPNKSPLKTLFNAGHTTGSPIDVDKPLISTKLDISTTSKSSNGDKSSSANVSLSSDNTEGAASRMEIVVSQPDPSNGSGIRCPCGVDDDLGVMVECESCSTWQHGHCINVGTEEEAYEGYMCAFCTLPQDKIRESLYQLTVDDKFQSYFKLLESLRRQNDTLNPEKQFSPNSTVENNTQLTMEELIQAIRDLNRVMSSLRVKWRLLTSQAYELELRIWQNPYWSDEPQLSLDKDKNFYFMDRCKSNLKLNIRNMVRKMEDRCQLIDYAIPFAESNEKSCNDNDSLQELRFKKTRQSLEEVAQGVKEFKNKLNNLSS